MTVETLQIRPPSSLNRSEKSRFRRIVRLLIASEVAVSDAHRDLICDLIATRGRLAKLQAEFDRKGETVGWPATMTLCGLINSTTTLARRLEKQLGLGART